MFDKHLLFIAGEWREAAGKKTFPVTNPATGETIANVPDGGAEDAEAAVNAASEAQASWGATSAAERSRVLRRWFDLIQAHTEELAAILTREQGKPLAESVGELRYGGGFVEWFAEEAKRAYGSVIPASGTNKRIVTIRQPVGVVAAITPWNFPCAMVTRKLAPALAAGCAVILKPAEQTPLTSMALVELLHQAGAPAGVINLLTGDPVAIGKTLMSDERVAKLTFTGSTDVGKILIRQSADTVKRLSLELGGHAPLLVFDDADIETAVNGTMAAKFRNAGQVCIACNRIYVQENIAPAFIEALTEQVKTLKLGPGMDPGTTIGPLIDEPTVQKVEKHVSDAIGKGAKLVYSSPQVKGGKGFYYPPTILDGIKESMIITQEETFGPVIPIQIFRTEEEAVRLANQSRTGLASYMFTTDLNRAIRVAESLETGIVGLNDGAVSTPQAPFGGYKESGVGREGGREGLDAFLETKYISIGM